MAGCVLLGAFLGQLIQNRHHLRRGADNLRLQLGLSAALEEPPGQWSRIAFDENHLELTASQIRERDRLRSLGYAGGSVPAPDARGVTIRDGLRSSSAPRLYCSGHGPVALLMDATGTVLHRWQFEYSQLPSEADSGREGFLPDTKGSTECWRRARLLPGGNLLAIFEGHGLIKLDRNSQLLWGYPGQCHHDLDLDPEGHIWVLSRQTELVPEIDTESPVLLDYITELSPQGKFLKRIDILQAFASSKYASFLTRINSSGDILHTNTLERLDGHLAHLSPLFREGNFLISVRELDLIAIIDGQSEAVVWALSGMWDAQHQPTLLDSGNILLFDNRGHQGRSKVLEIDPFSQQVVWEFADGPAHPLNSPTCGSCQSLPSGNIMITESDRGRALEVDRSGVIVWEYRNPRRTGPDDQFIAAIMEMAVLPEDFELGWLSQDISAR